MLEPFIPILPVFTLAHCPTCGCDSSGTLAKPGSTVRCARCKTMGRVPVGRPPYRPDDPATVSHPGLCPKDTPPGPQRPAPPTMHRTRPARPKPGKAQRS